MISRRLVPLALLLLCRLFATPTEMAAASAVDRGEIAALKARAGATGRVRVIVEIRASAASTPRRLRAAQRAIVTAAFGAEAWTGRDRADVVHGIRLMSVSPMFAAGVTAAEIDLLAAHPAVLRIVADGVAAPTR